MGYTHPSRQKQRDSGSDETGLGSVRLISPLVALPTKTHRRFEISASGIDDAVQGISTDPFSMGTAQASGLRIPPVLNVLTDNNPTMRPRYLFCLATRTVKKKSKLIGMRQGLTIGIDLANGAFPMKPLELNVTTPNFSFPDGNVSWHLVEEPNFRPENKRPATDTNNWAYRYSDGPAMLYQTFTNTTVTPTGAPVLYMRGLTAYTHPSLKSAWKPIEADLFSFRDLRFKWDSDRAWDHMNVEIAQNSRVSLYASVLQTNPNTRTNPITASGGPPLLVPAGTPPEWAFIAAYTSGGGGPETFGPQYWRVFGALIFEDEI